ncbi:MAG: class I SAM-dependent methyltransferase [Aphanocapsa sp. GSE-SYN-MK-11-07L]|jgi:SAM-dependent methyltransferase|nr:class I SAM-dependent methyltransferase [Aphanocapsa sp. GSE-SYN-MK-11-07L]
MGQVHAAQNPYLNTITTSGAMTMIKLPIKKIASCQEISKIIENSIRNKSSAGISLNILEAGCGQRWWFNLKDIPYHITGLDIDRDALEMRKNIQHDLDEIVEGDLRHVELPKEKYDVIYCAYVLEHIKESDAVLKNFYTWLKQGGLLVLRVPDPRSVRGFITNFTPHWFHVWAFKYIFGNSSAGKPGFGPFPTFYTDLLSRNGLSIFCEQNGFTITAIYGERAYYPRPVKPFIEAFIMIAANLSLGFLNGGYDNTVFMLEKDPEKKRLS